MELFAKADATETVDAVIRQRDACASEANDCMTSTGPKTSSCNFSIWLTLLSMVG